LRAEDSSGEPLAKLLVLCDASESPSLLMAIFLMEQPVLLATTIRRAMANPG